MLKIMKKNVDFIGDFIIKLIKGIIIGLAVLTAGAGTFAILFRIYDRCMEIIARPFRNFKKNLIYITPILIGILIGVLIFGDRIIYLLDNYNAYVKFVFLGIIVGGIPTLIKKANETGYDKKYLISLIVTFLFTILITYVSSLAKEEVENVQLRPFHLVIYGMVYGFGAIVPGMTTMHLLIYIGVFSRIMEEIMRLNLTVLIPFGIGYLFIVILVAKSITYLLSKYYGYTYYAIIGFAITSLIVLLPELKTVTEYILCPIYAIIAAVSMYYITKLESKILQQEQKIVKN